MTQTGKTTRMPEVAVRQRLLSRATELFTRKGYTATTVREIVEAAGVTKPVLYYYFRNKEGIYLELIREAFARFDAVLDASYGRQGSVTDRMLRLSDQVFSLFMENVDVARLTYSIHYGPPQGAPFFDFDAYHLKFQNVIEGLVREGIRNGEFLKGNAKDITWVIIGVVNVTMEVQLLHPEMGMERKRLARILKLIFRGISPERGRQEGKQR